MQQLTDGTMRRNKRTGEVQVLQGGQWVSQGASAPAALPQEIVGPPKEPAPQTTAQAEGDILGNEQKRRELNQPTFIPQGATQMMTPDGKVMPIPGANEAKQQQNAASLLKAAGVDLERGVDPVADLIRGSTSGTFEHLGAEAVGAFGHATPGMQNIGKLKTIVSDMVLQLTGGGLGNQVSDADRQFIIERVGDLANPDVPADQRLAAWDAVKQRMGNVLGIQRPLDDNQATQELKARIARGDDPSDTIHWLVSINRPPDKATIAAIMANASNSSPTVLPPDGGGGGGVLHNLGVGVSGVVQGAGDLLNTVSSPFIQGVNAVTGSNFNPDMGANARQALGTPDPQNNAEQMAFNINRFGTAALGGATGARAAAPYAGDIIGGALQRFGSAPLTDAFAGSAGGAASEGARQAGAGPLGQAAAGIAGGALSLPVASRGGNLINSLLSGPEPVPSLVQAGRQEGVTVNRAMVDPSRQQKVTAVGKTMVGGRMMQRDMGKIGGQIEGRVQALGNGGENLKEPSALGGTVQNVGKRFIKTSGEAFRNAYGSLRTQTSSVPIAPSEATDHIDAILARLNKAPATNAKEIAYLEGVKSDIANGIDVETARDIGSRLSRDISKGEVTFGKSEADVLDIRKALARDTENGLATAGRGDLAAKYKEVDAAYSQRMDFIKQKLAGLLGRRDKPLDPEKAAGRFTAMAGKRGDASGLYQILAKATPDERDDIAATYANMLGRDKSGAFSTSRLVTDIEDTPKAAQIAIFGKQGAKSLDNISELARAHKRVSNALGGSPTGIANDYRSYLWNLVIGGATAAGSGNAIKGMAVTGGLLAAKTGRDVINARLLMSPKIQGWLRSAPKTADPQAINAHFDRLKAIAVREPALAPQIQQLEEMILKAANDTGTSRAVASDGGEQNN